MSLILQTSGQETRITALEKLTNEISTDLKNKYAANSWMN